MFELLFDTYKYTSKLSDIASKYYFLYCKDLFKKNYIFNI